MNRTETLGSGCLSMWDTVSIIVGIVIGVSIFLAPPLIFSNVSSLWMGLGIWVFGGLISLIGACCYAELATAYPQSGGDYVYLTRAFGRMIGFLFGWAQLAAILTGSIGALAYVFAAYALNLLNLPDHSAVWLAVLAVGLLAMTNLLGLVMGKLTQNFLTVAKLVGLVAIVVAGLLYGGAADLAGTHAVKGPGFGLAVVLVLYAFGGWNDAAFVTAEVENPQRNIPLALLWGIGIITIAYVAVNLAYVWALGMEGLRGAQAPAAEVLEMALGRWGAQAMSLLVMVSALGAVNGMLLTGSRVLACLGGDHRLFGLMARENRFGAPCWALLALAGGSWLLILLVGTAAGRQLVDDLLMVLSLDPVPWETFGSGFETLVAATAPVFWTFFLLTGLSVFVLRYRDRDVERPFRVPLYPVTPILFCGVCVYMLYAAIAYVGTLALLGAFPVLLGLPLYIFVVARQQGWSRLLRRETLP